MLVIDTEPQTRLPVLAALSPMWDVHTHDDQEPIKAVRRVQPDLLLIALAGDAEPALRLIRVVRTDGGRVPRIGAYERPPHRLGPHPTLRTWGADGWLGDLDQIFPFANDIMRGPVTLGTFRPTLLRRLVLHLGRV